MAQLYIFSVPGLLTIQGFCLSTCCVRSTPWPIQGGTVISRPQRDNIGKILSLRSCVQWNTLVVEESDTGNIFLVEARIRRYNTGEIYMLGGGLLIKPNGYGCYWFGNYDEISVRPCKSIKVTILRNLKKHIRVGIIGGTEMGNNLDILKVEHRIEELLKLESDSHIVCGYTPN